MLSENPCNVLKSVSGFLRGQENSLLIDKPEVMQTLQALQIAFDNLPASEFSDNIRINNPMLRLKELIEMLNLVSRSDLSKAVANSHEVGSRIENNDEYLKTVIKSQFDKIGVFKDMAGYVDRNWKVIEASVLELSKNDSVVPMSKKIIKDVLCNKDETIKLLEKLDNDFYKKRPEYAKRLGIGGYCKSVYS